MVVCPGSELQCAVLLVKWEMLHLNLAGTLVNGWWQPANASIVLYNGICVQRDFIRAIRTKERRERREGDKILGGKIQLKTEKV